MDVDIFQLQCFIHVVEQKSFTKAALEVCTSQSALSKHISRLEDELNIQLFDRSHRAVALTPRGRRLSLCQKLLDDYNEMMASIKRLPAEAISTSAA